MSCHRHDQGVFQTLRLERSCCIGKLEGFPRPVCCLIFAYKVLHKLFGIKKTIIFCYH